MVRPGPKPKPRRKFCIICGDKITHGRDERKTCSDACRRELIRKKREKQTPPRPVVIHKIKCIICRKKYEMTGKEYNLSNRKTCGKKCEHVLRSRSKIGNRIPPQSTAIITAKRSAHPNTGPFETHKKAIQYAFRSPRGKEYRGRNLAFFVRKNKRLFADPNAAYFGLARLNPNRSNPRRSWHGWTWIKDE